MEAVLDGRKCTDRTKAHEALKEVLKFPEYYGKNLDALFDCASTLSNTRLTICHWDMMVEALGHYGHLILSTLLEAAEENSGFEVLLEDPHEEDLEMFAHI